MSGSKTVVVTGGASGIGEATVRLFAERGWSVEIADLNETRGAQVGGEIGAQFSRLDVTSEAEIEAYAEAVYGRRGRVDAMVSSAGLLQNAVRVTEMAIEEYDRNHAVNVRGSLLMNRCFGARMAQDGGGAIVNLGSLTSFRPSGQPAYAMGKAAIVMMTELLAAELGPQGVRVNAVAPGYVLTPAMQARIDGGLRDPSLMIERSALRRLVQPVEVARTIFFLCSEEAGAIAGATVPVDCGWLAASAYGAYAAVP